MSGSSNTCGFAGDTPCKDLDPIHLKGIVDNLAKKVCELQAKAVQSIGFQSDGSIKLTHVDGSIQIVEDVAMKTLFASVQTAINDGTRVAGLRISSTGDLILIRANNTETIIGNIPAVADPIRGIEIRQDGRLEISSLAGTKYTSQRKVQDVIESPEVSPGLAPFILYDTPKLFIDSTTPKGSGTTVLTNLPGVSNPLGMTHAIIAVSIEHFHAWDGWWYNGSYSWLNIRGKEVVRAGRSSYSSVQNGNSGGVIQDQNSSVIYVPIPGDFNIPWTIDALFTQAGQQPNPISRFYGVAAKAWLLGFCKAQS